MTRDTDRTECEPYDELERDLTAVLRLHGIERQSRPELTDEERAAVDAEGQAVLKRILAEPQTPGDAGSNARGA